MFNQIVKKVYVFDIIYYFLYLFRVLEVYEVLMQRVFQFFNFFIKFYDSFVV